MARYIASAIPHQHQQRQIRGNSTCVLQPLADVQPDDVETHGDREQHERTDQQKCAILRTAPRLSGPRRYALIATLAISSAGK